ncbi:hypothetical protein SDC9_139944 [bioreactor metagenome]|uniref:Uncharacterized protein n=1 Tax=bioreactor metagenome TaxID=1076179 RepID=A0A645DUK6_9ZZZZ
MDQPGGGGERGVEDGGRPVERPALAAAGVRGGRVVVPGAGREDPVEGERDSGLLPVDRRRAGGDPRPDPVHPAGQGGQLGLGVGPVAGPQAGQRAGLQARPERGHLPVQADPGQWPAADGGGEQGEREEGQEQSPDRTVGHLGSLRHRGGHVNEVRSPGDRSITG